MKKIYILLALLAILLIGVYLLFPSQRQITITLPALTNMNNAMRVLNNRDAWNFAMGKGEQQQTSTDTVHYRLVPPGNEEVVIGSNGREYKSIITVLPQKSDSLIFVWQANLKTGHWPWQRIQLLSQKTLLKQKMNLWAYNLTHYMASDSLSYGAEMVDGRVTDTTLITYTFNTPNPPTVEQVYAAIQGMEQYVNKLSAALTNHPMLLTRPAGSGYQTQIALPTTRALPETGTYKVKRMFPGHCVYADITGGPATIHRVYENAQLFITEFHYTMPAIPFQSLVTNRLLESDTTKWKTRWVFPVY